MKRESAMEVFPGIFRITERGMLGMLKPPVNIYVITGKDGLVYDAGYGSRSSIRSFSKQYKSINKICKERGIETHIDRILLSHAHADHFSGLTKLRKRFGFRVMVTDDMKKIIINRKVYTDSYAPPDKKEMKTITRVLCTKLKLLKHKIEYGIYELYWGVSFIKDPDIIVLSESEIFINDERWSIFPSPGHSNEHITLYNSEKGVLFSGDNILNSINVWLGPPKSDIDEYENSLRYILKLPQLKIILPAHGSPVTDPYGRINAIIEWRLKRTNDILNILKNVYPEGLSIKDILCSLYPMDNRMKKGFASGWVELTVEKLEGEKKLLRNKNKYYYMAENQ